MIRLHTAACLTISYFYALNLIKRTLKIWYKSGSGNFDSVPNIAHLLSNLHTCIVYTSRSFHPLIRFFCLILPAFSFSLPKFFFKLPPIYPILFSLSFSFPFVYPILTSTIWNIVAKATWLELENFSDKPFLAEMGFSKSHPCKVKKRKSSEFDGWYLKRTALAQW